jgi:hypothetical protein
MRKGYVKNQEKNFCEATGLSRATYYRRKRAVKGSKTDRIQKEMRILDTSDTFGIKVGMERTSKSISIGRGDDTFDTSDTKIQNMLGGNIVKYSREEFDANEERIEKLKNRLFGDEENGRDIQRQ